MNINILGINELKWMGMGEFNSNDHYIYHCAQESLKKKNKRSSPHGHSDAMAEWQGLHDYKALCQPQ